MKKIIGAMALLCSIAIFLVLRQLNSQSKAPGRKVNVTAIMRDHIILTTLLMQ